MGLVIELEAFQRLPNNIKQLTFILCASITLATCTDEKISNIYRIENVTPHEVTIQFYSNF